MSSDNRSCSKFSVIPFFFADGRIMKGTAVMCRSGTPISPFRRSLDDVQYQFDPFLVLQATGLGFLIVGYTGTCRNGRDSPYTMQHAAHIHHVSEMHERLGKQRPCLRP